jgi:toxin HigB-1
VVDAVAFAPAIRERAALPARAAEQPPGKLKGERGGQYSIRINDQWRVCFRWADSGAEDVEIVDYH